jgi:hypothetical protein
MPKGTVNGEPYEVPDGYRIASEAELYRGHAALSLLSDLDRSSAGRHKGDAEFQDPSGYSQGNPLLVPGMHVGHTISGQRIVVPENPADPAAWIVP